MVCCGMILVDSPSNHTWGMDGCQIRSLILGKQHQIKPIDKDSNYYDTTTQPMDAIVLSYPRIDMIRLWPLPAIHLWFEDRPGKSLPFPVL